MKTSDRCTSFCATCRISCNDITSDETAYAKTLEGRLSTRARPGDAVLGDCIQTARALMVGESYAFDRCYTNMILYGDFQGPHIDPPGGITAVYYANPEWKEQWLGETIFYDEQRQPVHAVGVKPGRLALFHSDILHRAGVPVARVLRAAIVVAFTSFHGEGGACGRAKAPTCDGASEGAKRASAAEPSHAARTFAPVAQRTLDFPL